MNKRMMEKMAPFGHMLQALAAGLLTAGALIVLGIWKTLALALLFAGGVEAARRLKRHI